jgi:Uma2 family endonuclease
MALPQQSEMTLDAFLKLPDEKPALEFADGMVSQKAPPQTRHAFLQSGIAGLINRSTQPAKTAFASTEQRTTYGGRSTVPDIAVIAWDHIPLGPDGRVVDVLEGPPEIAIEIISPGQRTNALVTRLLWYVANGVGAALLVDPDDDSVVVFRPNAVPQSFIIGDDIDLNDVIPGLTLSVGELFSVLTP